MAGPLQGIRVLDITNEVAGSYAARLLAGYGAETIKLESPQGNSLRNFGPFPDNQQEDLQTLTINDTTFLNNRTKTVGTTGTTDAREHTHFAYVDLLRTENGRQYSLNVDLLLGCDIYPTIPCNI